MSDKQSFVIAMLLFFTFCQVSMCAWLLNDIRRYIASVINVDED